VPQITSQRLSELNHGQLITAEPQLTVAAALSFVHEHQIHHLPLVKDGELLGLVCTCDLYEARPEQQLGEVMKSPPVTLDLNATALDAAEAMEARSVGSVVVVEGARAVGIVTRGDLLERAPGVSDVLSLQRCECCGLTRHLRTNRFEQTLCIYCDERAQEVGWFEAGGHG
jgi:predicted transcriptional regulator